MTRRLPAIAALTAAALCLCVGACGDGDDASSDAPKADAGQDSRLGTARFDALDAVYVAAVPIDELENEKDPPGSAKFKAATGPFLEACDALDREDPLLGALRRGCPLLATFTEQSAAFEAACQSPTSCSAAISDVRTTLANLKRFIRSSDRAVEAANITSACKAALRTPKKGYAVYDELDSAFGVLQRALKSGSEADLKEAQRRLDGLDPDASPSAKESLEKFRTGCD